MNKKISVRLTDDLLAKIKNWRSKGISLSDTIRQALLLLPNSPEEISQTQASMQIKPLHKVEVNFKLKDEVYALKALQEW